MIVTPTASVMTAPALIDVRSGPIARSAIAAIPTASVVQPVALSVHARTAYCVSRFRGAASKRPLADQTSLAAMAGSATKRLVCAVTELSAFETATARGRGSAI